ncbi:hypothetical protein Pmani_010871 [Petrolisthes manimaculis]|uniref:Uncharacterized protein n=1 Tax=Petrolisthes manimaculis TaxID=1843537 RepID=A0AAE1Q187_9EUCA|nr:hypothetical protein Pmani_010871 [Petrolisthes manimaculis]
MTSAVAVVACVVVAAVSVMGQNQATLNRLRGPLTNMDFAQLRENMANPNTVSYYVNCVISKGACDRTGNALKSIVLDQRATLQLCGGCTPDERERVTYVLDTLLINYTDLACEVQTSLKWNGLFGTSNPCL